MAFVINLFYKKVDLEGEQELPASITKLFLKFNLNFNPLSCSRYDFVTASSKQIVVQLYNHFMHYHNVNVVMNILLTFRGSHLMIWIKSALSIHMSYLMTVGSYGYLYV